MKCISMRHTYQSCLPLTGQITNPIWWHLGWPIKLPTPGHCLVTPLSILKDKSSCIDIRKYFRRLNKLQLQLKKLQCLYTCNLAFVQNQKFTNAVFQSHFSNCIATISPVCLVVNTGMSDPDPSTQQICLFL